MRTDFFMPPGSVVPTGAHLRGLPANAMAVACRDGRFRRLIGWLGLARCRGQRDAFTCRMASHRGVFGLAWETESTQASVPVVRFGLHYFPVSDEALCDRLRLDAAVATQGPEYLQAVREFVSDMVLGSAFRIGTVELACDAKAGLGLRLVAERVRYTVSDAGVGDESHGWALAPGDMEESLPALALAKQLADALAGAVSLCMGMPPAFTLQAEWAGGIWHRRADGTLYREPCLAEAAAHMRQPEQELCGADEGDLAPHLVAEATVWGDSPLLRELFSYSDGTTPLSLAPEWAYVGGGGPDCIPGCPSDAMPGFAQGSVPATLPVPLAQRRCGEGADESLPAAGCADAPCWLAHDLDSPDCLRRFPAVGDKRPALVVVSGFLGAGKTTFLNNCIEYHRSRERFVAVIQNEVGATGVDEHLLGDSASVVALDEGCVCCTLAGSLASGIRSLTERFTPEVILLETTGLANPLNLLAELDALRDMARLDCLITVVDAAYAVEALRSSEIARDQIRGADILVCNKCDTVDPVALAALEETLAVLNPRAVRHRTEFGRIHPSLFMDMEGSAFTDGAFASAAPASEPLSPETHAFQHREVSAYQSHGVPASGVPFPLSPRPLIPRQAEDSCTHPRPARHVHHADHVIEGFTSLRLFFPVPVAFTALDAALRESPGTPFRIKGMVSVTGLEGEAWSDDLTPGEGRHVLVQCVCGRVDYEQLYDFAGDSFLVFIGKGLDAGAIVRHWQPLGATEQIPAGPCPTGRRGADDSERGMSVAHTGRKGETHDTV